MKLCSIKEVFG